MASNSNSPKRESTPNAPLATPNAPLATPLAAPTPSILPQKRVLEDDHAPAISSPLNPDFKPAKEQPEDEPSMARARASRAKKESLKKREAKAGPAAVADPRSSTPSPAKQKNGGPIIAPLRYKLPPPKKSDFDPPTGPIFTPHHKVRAPDGSEIQFHETSEHVYNKKLFRYTHCIADPSFPSSLYFRQSETAPFNPRLNFEDTSTHMFHTTCGTHITTDKGFRMAKANVCARFGRYYWECRITSGIPSANSHAPPPSSSSTPHVRIGFARREATLDAPVGFDAYSYGLRDAAGQKVHLSRPKPFFPRNESICEGDVIGLEITLPSETLHRKVVKGHYNKAVDAPSLGTPEDEEKPAEAHDIIRDRVPIRFKGHLYFEQCEYSSTKEAEELMNPSPMSLTREGTFQDPNPNHPAPSLRTLPGSSIRVYKNGKDMGIMFEDLLAFLPGASKPAQGQQGAREGLDDGMLGYYPAVSVFRGGAAEVNFGPRWWFPPPGWENEGEEEGEDDEVDMVGNDIPPVEKSGKGKGKENGVNGQASKGRLRAMGERYEEQIVEDVLYDIIDEVDWWMRDGGVAGKGPSERAYASGGPGAGGGAGPGGLDGGLQSEEIKELVQDDE